MDAKVIRFPVERRRSSVGRDQVAVGFGATSLPGPRPEGGTPFSVLSIEIRRVRPATSAMDDEVAPRVLNRCVLAALEVLARTEGALTVGGTPERPVLQIRYEGPAAAGAAVLAGAEVRDAVRRAQRAGEGEFQVSGAVAAGSTSRTEAGVRVTLGRPESVAVRLREAASAGQIVMSDGAWAACEPLVEVHPAGEVTMVPGARPVQVYALRGLRTEDR
ncbi:MAG: hypothetical protein HY658_10355 [Actinobacteria bacterium]|nr:hypothetical protein [Actinomycetota bacterium]